MPPFSPARRLRVPLLIVLALVLLGASRANAASPPGSLDSTFGQSGFSNVSYGQWAAAAAVAVEPNGDIVTAGETQLADGTSQIIATRMLPSGQLDPSFGADGIAAVKVYGVVTVDSGGALAVQPNGDIVIVGGAPGPSTGWSYVTVRLLPSGQLDPSFGQNGISLVPVGAAAIATGVAVQPDGRIDVGGGTESASSVYQAAVIQLTPSGQLDPTFGQNGVSVLPQTGTYAWGLTLEPGGDIVLGGQETYGQNSYQMFAARFLPDGTPDPSFGSAGTLSLPVGSVSYGFAIIAQPNGRLLLTGPAYTNTGVLATVAILPSGQLDPSFGTGGVSTVDDWYGSQAIALQSNGQIVMDSVGLTTVRLNGNGSLDTGFGTAGTSTISYDGYGTAANGIAVAPDGGIIVAGAVKINGEYQITVARLNGTPQTTPPPLPPGKTPPPAPPPGHTKHKRASHHRRHRHKHRSKHQGRGHHRAVKRRQARWIDFPAITNFDA